MENSRIELYGTEWCLKSTALRNFMQSKWVEFDDFNVETDEEAREKVMALYDGKLKFPTLIYKGEHLKNPSSKELSEFLIEKGVDL